MKNLKQKIAVLILAALAAGSIGGCKTQTASTTGKEANLKYWVYMNSDASSVMSNFGETKLAQKLDEKLGTKVTYVHPPLGQEKEKFNILVASNELPDIIEYYWQSYPGGPQKAINEKLIVNLNEYKDLAPNLFKYLDAHEDIKKLVQTDNGDIFAFPFIRGDESLLVSQGIIIRQDWLDELGLPMPETIAEWETTLKAFRDKKGAAAPLSFNYGQFTSGYFSGAYGVTSTFYRDGNTIKFGPAEPGFKEFLTTMNRWYKEKLLDPNFAMLDSKTIDSNILNGVAGATINSIGRGIGKWMSGKVSDGYKLEGAPVPVLNKGEKPEFGFKQLPIPGSSFSAVTEDSKNKEAAIKFLDYGYGEEGAMLYNFGIEGESYTMVDGYPKYTDLITKNSEGLSMTAALSLYTKSFDRGPFIQDKRYMEQYAVLPEQKRAWKTWENTNESEHLLPIIYPKDDELSEYADINNAVSTYSDEMMLKFIVGTEPLEKYDEFVTQLKSRGLDRLLEIKQNAYNRFLERN